MVKQAFPVIDLVATGDNIRRLRVERGLTVKDLQRFFGFEEPRAVYKWQKGETLPSVDNLYALGVLLGVPMEAILIQRQAQSPAYEEQQERSCCSGFIWKDCWQSAVVFPVRTSEAYRSACFNFGTLILHGVLSRVGVNRKAFKLAGNGVQPEVVVRELEVR